jgi:hypothetical protein
VRHELRTAKGSHAGGGGGARGGGGGGVLAGMRSAYLSAFLGNRQDADEELLGELS